MSAGLGILNQDAGQVAVLRIDDADACCQFSAAVVRVVTEVVRADDDVARGGGAGFGVGRPVETDFSLTFYKSTLRVQLLLTTTNYY